MTTDSIAQLLREASKVLDLDEKTVEAIDIEDIDSYIDGLIDRLEAAAASLEAQEPETYVAINRKGAHCGFSRDGKDLEFRFRGIDTVSIAPLYRHPPTTSAVPDAATEEMLTEGVAAMTRGIKIFGDNYTQIVSNVWEDMLAAAQQQGGGEDE